MILLVPLAAGLGVGLIVGRWWALAAAPVVGFIVYDWAKPSSDVRSDIPWGELAIVYGIWACVLSAVGVLIGIAVRRLRRPMKAS
jgi:hypothetical protein